MIIKLDAKSKHLEMRIEISSKNPMTNAVFSDSKYSLNKQLQAVCIGLRSELLMFLINTEREMDIK